MPQHPRDRSGGADHELQEFVRTQKRVPFDSRASALAREAVQPAIAVDAGERLVDALHLLREADAPGIAVIHAGRLVGTLSQLDIDRGLELRELGHPKDRAGVRSTA